MLLSPSLLSADLGRLAEELQALEQAGLSWAHWDVMDGLFVPNLTFGAPVIKKLRPVCKLFFDVHLMIEHPERYLQDFAEAGADLLVVHAEAATHLPRTLEEIKRLGMRCGVALNPATPLCCLEHILPELDLVLIMSVNPGFSGQRFMPGAYAKIGGLRQRIDNSPAAGSEVLIQVDGGVDPQNAPLLVAAGADVLVSGSAFFGFPPYAQRVKIFQDAVAQKC
ncbi:MAG: ribulose-phosphate 3-epimerase [Deltaproteobacteria bacterium]|jgi:ribulose-phosphate 3-epimerase|nr:ribulose-phosphate 3-epimerase [Deltaproteobacteria bacterium]